MFIVGPFIMTVEWLLFFLLILLTVAFFTLFERKFMGLIHLRLGPNKMSFSGLLQPLLDALKLLTKQPLVSIRVNPVSFHFSPHFGLVISLLAWVSLPMPSNYNSYSMLFFMFMSSFMVFSVLLGGWASNSKYSFLGSLRSVSQSISYEAVFTTLSVTVLLFCSTYSLDSIGVYGSVFLVFLFPIWLFTTLAETHRAPFDFAESESELVSGYNTEYGGAYFAYYFLSEYSILILSSYLMTWVFFSFLVLNPFLQSIISLSILSLTIWIRVTFCRYRYDKLMMAAWKSYLPVSFSLLVLYLLLS